jgi:hypothetical protein
VLYHTHYRKMVNIKPLGKALHSIKGDMITQKRTDQ